MSLRYEYVPPNAGVQYLPEAELDVENPEPDQQVLVLWYDEAIIIPATPGEIANLVDRIAAAVGLTHDTESAAARERYACTGRYPLRL